MPGITLRIDGIDSSSLLISQTDNKLKLEFPPGLSLEGYRSDYPIAASIGKYLNDTKLDVTGYAYGLRDYRWLIGYRLQSVAKADYDAGTLGILPTSLYMKLPEVSITVDATRAITAAAGTVTLPVSCNTAWTYSIIGDGFSSASVGVLGNGSLAIAVTENQGFAREGIITITAAGHTAVCTITQDQKHVTVTSLTDTFDENGGATELTQTVTTTPAGGTWTASTTTPWITGITASGTDGQTLSYTTAANTGVARTGAILVTNGVGTCEIAISQDSVTAAITVSETPIAVSNSSGGGSRDVTINLQGAIWVASSNASWLTVTPASHTGDGALTYSYPANTGVERSATISIRTGAGTAKQIVVTQAVASDSITITNTTVAVTAAYTANPVTHTVTSRPIGVNWTATSNSEWLTVLTASGANGDVVQYTVAENLTAQRVGLIQVNQGGNHATITVTQAAAVASNLALTPATISTSSAVGFGTSVLSGVLPLGAAWSATSTVGWITIDTPTGTGNQTLTFRWSEHIDLERTGEVHITCGSYTTKCVITQAAAQASVTITNNTAGYEVDAPGGTDLLTGRIVTVRPVSGETTCESNQAWCRPSVVLVNGVGELKMTLDPNPDGTTRLTVVTIRHAFVQEGVMVSQRPSQSVITTLANNGALSYDVNGCEFTLRRAVADSNPINCSSNVGWLRFGLAAGMTQYDAITAIGTGTALTTMSTNHMGTETAFKTLIWETNPTQYARTGIITVTCGAVTRTFEVSQAGMPLPLQTRANPSGSFNSTAAGGTVAHTMITNVTPASNLKVLIPPTAPWLTCGPVTLVSGSMRFSLTAAKNTDIARSVYIYVVAGGLYFKPNVTQAAAAASITLAPASITSIPKAGATRPILVTCTPNSVGWSALTATPWASVTPVTNVSGTYLTLTVAPNTTGKSRTGSLTIKYGTNFGSTKTLSFSQSGTV